MEIVEKAYAKINLSLDCINKRNDGYHELKSIMLPLKFHDTINFQLLQKEITDDFITCDSFSLKISKYNLCHKMIDVLRERFKFKDHFNIKIHKNIFLQSGLGGGSADAAAVFRCIIKHYKLNLKDEEIKEICNEVGSDVYFQFYNKPALVSGRGDKIEFLNINETYNCLLVSPEIGNSTSEIFKEADNMELVHKDINKVKEDLLNNDLESLGKDIFNSLYEPAKKNNKEIENIINLLKEKGFECVLMTGSGSCVFALTSNKLLIKKVEKELYLKGYDVESSVTLK